MDWKIRKARPEDASRVVVLARNYDEFLMPYVLNEFVVRNYTDQFLVAELEKVGVDEHYSLPSLVDNIGGAVHYITKWDGLSGQRFLFYIKQVPSTIIEEFGKIGSAAFLGQIVCPGKGSFYAILEELKKQYDELWCWMSVVGPSYKSYERYGFRFYEQKKFWNVYKCNYSTFTLGKWIKEVKV